MSDYISIDTVNENIDNLDEVYGIIYLHESPSGGIYVGQTIHSIDYRTRRHCESANRGSTCIFHNAIRKYGIDKFTSKIIAVAYSKKELNDLEIYYIKYYNSYYKNDDGTNNDKGYNMTIGGEATNGFKFNDEQKISISNGVKEYYNEHPERGQAISIRQTEYWSNDENRLQKSKDMINGFKEHPERGQAISIRQTEYWSNDENKLQKSEDMIKFYVDNPNQREHLSNKAIQQWSDETKRNEQSERKKQQYIDNPLLKNKKKEYYDKNPDERVKFSILKKKQIQNNPELKAKMTKANQENNRKRFTIPTFSGYSDSEYKNKLGQWNYVGDAQDDLFNGIRNPHIRRVLNKGKGHTRGIYFKYNQ